MITEMHYDFLIVRSRFILLREVVHAMPSDGRSRLNIFLLLIDGWQVRLRIELKVGKESERHVLHILAFLSRTLLSNESHKQIRFDSPAKR